MGKMKEQKRIEGKLKGTVKEGEGNVQRKDKKLDMKKIEKIITITIIKKIIYNNLKSA